MTNLQRNFNRQWTTHSSEDALSRLFGIAADGAYQASGFSEHLRDILNIAENEHVVLPLTWDPAHALNLVVTDARDARNKSGKFLRHFKKRCDVFKHVFANGKGFNFFEIVDSKERRPVSYAQQRFASSSYDQWIKIEASYDSFWQAFDLLYPNRDQQEWQYMIAGSDFVEDMLALLDIMEPVVKLMARVQSLETPIRNLKLWWSKVKECIEKVAKGEEGAYPRLMKVKDALEPNRKFKGVTLLEGWVVTTDKGKYYGVSRFTWSMQSKNDAKNDCE